MGLTVCILLVVAASSAPAQVIPCAGGPCMKAHRRGTHFLAELYGGSVLAGDGGLDVGGLVGFGGKLRGFPLRFYLIGEFSYSSLSGAGHIGGTNVAFREDYSFRDLALGLRIYIPVGGPLRLFVDGMGGGSFVINTMDRNDLAPRSVQDWRSLGLVAAGLQLRLIRHLSLGLRAKLSYTSNDSIGMFDERGTWRPSITAGLTWHF